jgi:hypothetical protein
MKFDFRLRYSTAGLAQTLYFLAGQETKKSKQRKRRAWRASTCNAGFTSLA